MVKPLLEQYRTPSQPGCMHTGNYMSVTVAVAVPVPMRRHMCHRLRVEEEVSVERLAAAHAHEDAAEEEHARHAERTQALDLAEAHGELLRRRPQAPGHGAQRQDVGGEVRQAVPGVGDHGLRVEQVATHALGYGHAQIGEEADPGDAHACVVLVLGREVDIIVVMVVAVAGVAVAGCDHDRP